MRIGWSSRAECVEVVWTHGENGGGPVMKRIVGSDMRGVRLRGRLQTGWMNDVRRA